jgi:hypothetical protein
VAPTSKPLQDKAASAALAALRQLRVTDLRGVARLATQATTGVTHITEGVHQSVLGTMGLPGGKEVGRTRGLTGLVYQGVREITRLVDVSLQAALLRLEPFLERGANAALSPEREAVLSALNGVMGDRLAEDGNPLALTMELRQQGRATGSGGPARLGPGHRQGAAAGAWPVHERPAVAARRPRPRRASGAGAGLHPRVCALQHRAAHLHQRRRNWLAASKPCWPTGLCRCRS